MSEEKRPEDKEKDEEITDKDIFGSIPKPIIVDPFEGIDIERISVSAGRRRDDNKESREGREHSETDVDDLFKSIEFRRIDIEDISVFGGSLQRREVWADKEQYPVSTHVTIDRTAPQTDFQPSSKTPLPETTPEKELHLPGVLGKAYKYTEINRIREKIVSTLHKQGKKTALVVSPHDDAGNSLLISLLGLNAAYFTGMKVLLLDLNLRRPALHISFGLELAKGFSEIAEKAIDWKETVKDTGLATLKIITAGMQDDRSSSFFNQFNLEDIIHEIKEYYDLVLFDASPVLVGNKNNVDPIYLSTICEMVIIVVQDKKTTRDEMIRTAETISNSGGKVSGIVYNHKF